MFTVRAEHFVHPTDVSSDAGWDARFARGASQSRWPWSDVVSYVMRHARLDAGARVLELGCGVGANAPFFTQLGTTYYAVEGSATAVSAFRERFPELREHIAHGDFTRDLLFDGPFDLILDRSALTHNALDAITRALQLCHAALRPGGHYIGIDWFSSGHVEAARGSAGPDAYTKTFDAGLFAGVGNVHFSDEGHLRDMFAAWELVALDEKIYARHEPPPPSSNATWIIVARKGTDGRS